MANGEIVSSGQTAIVNADGSVIYSGTINSNNGWNGVEFFKAKDVGAYDWFPYWEGYQANTESWESLFRIANILYK